MRTSDLHDNIANEIINTGVYFLCSASESDEKVLCIELLLS